MQNAWVIPTFFELQQRMAGTKINGGGVYLWAAYGSWPYDIMSVISDQSLGESLSPGSGPRPLPGVFEPHSTQGPLG